MLAAIWPVVLVVQCPEQLEQPVTQLVLSAAVLAMQHLAR